MRKIIRRKIALQKCDISASTAYRLEKSGEFPARIQISKGLVGYFEDLIDEWIAARPLASGTGRRGLPTTGESQAA